MKVLRIPPSRLAGLAALLTAGVLTATAMVQAQTAPVLQPATVLGPSVTLTWSAVPGASNYVVLAGLAPGQFLLNVPAGNVTSVQVNAPLGTYYVAVQGVDGNGTPVGGLSNQITVSVTSLFVPPAAPTNLETFFNGSTVVFTWAPGAGGGAPTAFYLQAGSSPGAGDIGTFPVGSGTEAAVPNVPAARYYVRVLAHNGGGFSPASNEVELNMPVGGACSVPPARPFSYFAFGRYVQFQWAPVPGAAGYRLDFSTSPGGPIEASLPTGGASATVTNAPLGTFYGKLTAAFACGTQSQGPETTVVLDGAPPPGPRAPNPAPGTQLPFPNFGRAVVEQLARERPDLLHSSCTYHEGHSIPGGNNRFMFEAVRRLRAIDNRFGLNWKRGLFGDMSQDIVNYNFGSQPDEGTWDVYIIDIIGGHCGPNPGPNWQDQTQATRDGGTIGVWTLLPYMNAGYPIISDPQ